MNSIREFLRRFLPNRLNLSRNDFSFELLRSASAQELKKCDNSRQQLMWPRPTSSHQHFHINEADLEADGMIEIFDENGGKIQNDETTLLGFTEYVSDTYNRIAQSTAELSLSGAIAECNIIRSNPCFSEGILLKCVEPKPLYHYLHYALFKNPDHNTRIAQIDHTIREIHGRPKSQFGAYDEIYAIQKTSPIAGYKLPSHRHAGYIIILFKLLDEQTRHENLEKSWLSWTGAREVYKYSPTSWNLRRIVLHKLPTSKRQDFRPFAYVLFCEFGNILNPSNRLQALDMVERLRIRNCGYISLYQVHWSYRRMSNSHGESSNSQKLFSFPDEKRERNLMLRGFSQDTEPMIDTSQHANNSRKYSGHSIGTQINGQSMFHSCHHFRDFQ